MREFQMTLDFSNSSAILNPVTTVDAVRPKASRSAVVGGKAPSLGRHTHQANCGSTAAAEHGAFVSDNAFLPFPDAMSPADRYVASRVGGTFSACGTYVQEALDIVDGSTVRPGTYLKVRKNQTTQSIGLKESYCPACELVFATAWKNHHLFSRQHLFTVALHSPVPQGAPTEEDVT